MIDWGHDGHHGYKAEKVVVGLIQERGSSKGVMEGQGPKEPKALAEEWMV